MIQVKIFYQLGAVVRSGKIFEKLENQINQWLKENPGITVTDMKYQSFNSSSALSVILIYQEAAEP